MKDKWEILLGGSGGQGIIVAGMLLGESAAVYDGRHTLQTQAYGIAARGGYCKAEVIISNEEIANPTIGVPDIALALTREAYDLCQNVSPETLLIFDTAEVTGGSTPAREIGVPLTEMARELGGVKATNIVALGVIVGLTGLVSPAAVQELIRERYPKDDLNYRAFTAGVEYAEKNLKGGSNLAQA